MAMRREHERPARREGRRSGFWLGASAGVTCGLVLGAGLGAVADEEAVTLRDFAKRTLYAVGDLAVDTEANAKRIVDLESRVDDLELRLEALGGAGDGGD